MNCFVTSSARATSNALLILAILALFPLPALAGGLKSPEHVVGIELGQAFVGVLVYDDETEIRVANDWYRIQISSTTVERFATGSFTILGLLIVGAGCYILHRRWKQPHASHGNRR